MRSTRLSSVRVGALVLVVVACAGTSRNDGSGDAGHTDRISSGGGGADSGGTPGATAGGRAGAGGTSGIGGSGGNPGGDAGAGGAAGKSTTGSAYDDAVLADGPVAFWAMNGSGTERDLTGNGHDGTYRGGTPSSATLPNGDPAADFNGKDQYLTVPSSAAFSIPTTKNLTWEGWMRPDVLQFPNDSNGYVDWMGKCEQYSPSCEWEARLYDRTNSENRCNRLSAYAFDPDGNLGSGAFWQQAQCGVSIVANDWYHVVGEYTLESQPSVCQDTTEYPGSIDIWVNGVRWNQSSHGDTGCMSQYHVVPKANGSALNIGTMAKDAWFEGAIGKVAIYSTLLSDAVIARHYRTMTGKAKAGSCADTCSF